MRPGTMKQCDSLYFEYPVFDGPTPDALRSGTTKYDVIIVGAGPVGLATAVSLAAQGVRCLVVEAKETFNDGSRAICLAQASMQIFDHLGIVEPFLVKALEWTTGRCYYRGEEVHAFNMPHSASEKFYPMYNLQQQYIEQFLFEAVQRLDLIDTWWLTTAVLIEQDDEQAELEVEHAGERHRLRCKYVVAADGARSAMRGLMGLRLAGENCEGRYVIADIKAAIDRPTERVALFEPLSDVGSTLLVHRQPDDIWRVDWQLADSCDEADPLSEAAIRSSVAKILAELDYDGEWELEWWSGYSANTLCLDDYRHGRVFFAGDSAHIVPIFGVRGLNNGIADAFNIGWRLGYVLDGRAAPTTLEQYSAERRAATLEVFAAASKSTRFMTPPSRGWRVAREAVLSLARDHAFARPFADPRQMRPHVYSNVPGWIRERDRQFEDGPAVGSMCPDAQLAEERHLLDETGSGTIGIVFGSVADDDLHSQLLATGRRCDPAFTLVAVGPPQHDDTDGMVSKPVQDAWRRFAARPGSFYLLRPDLHIALRTHHVTPADLTRGLRTILDGDDA